MVRVYIMITRHCVVMFTCCSSQIISASSHNQHQRATEFQCLIYSLYIHPILEKKQHKNHAHINVAKMRKVWPRKHSNFNKISIDVISNMILTSNKSEQKTITMRTINTFKY